MANKIIDGSLEITGQAIFDSSLSDGANEILISNIASKDFVEANPSIESGTVTTALDSLRIESNYYTVSGGGSTYTAGTGIDITSDVISIDSSVVALQSDLPVGEYDVLLNDSTVTPTSIVDLSNIVTGNSTDGYTKYNVFINPMTTAGDIILGNSSGAPSRLGIGTSGQVLTSNGTTASWQTPSGGGLDAGFKFWYNSDNAIDCTFVLLTADSGTLKYEKVTDNYIVRNKTISFILLDYSNRTWNGGGIINATAFEKTTGTQLATGNKSTTELASMIGKEYFLSGDLNIEGNY